MNIPVKKESFLGRGISSVVEHLPSMYKALYSILKTTTKINKLMKFLTTIHYYDINETNQIISKVSALTGEYKFYKNKRKAGHERNENA
jgi:pantothenate kinase